MGNTKNTAGKRIFDDVYSFPQDSQDLANDIYDFANMRVGTSTERQALPTAQAKGLWLETDTGRIYRYSSGWVHILGGEVVDLAGTYSANWSATAGYSPVLVVDGPWRHLFGAASRASGGSLAGILTIPDGHRPSGNQFLGAHITSTGTFYELHIASTGVLSAPTGYNNSSAPGAYPLRSSWRVG